MKDMGKESPLGLSLKEGILKVVKPASLPIYLCHDIFDYWCKNCEKIYQAD